MNETDKLRKIIREKRDLLDEKNKFDKSEIIVNKLIEIYEKLEHKIGNVIAYFPIGNEVNIRKFLEFVIKIKKLGFVILPKVINNTEMKFFYVNDLENQIQKCYKNLLFEPILELKEFDFCEKKNKQIDLMIIPGVVFDQQCNRIGQGCGFYDRFLMNKNTKNLLKIGIGYDFQILEKIPNKTTDVPMDMLVSETKIYSR